MLQRLDDQQTNVALEEPLNVKQGRSDVSFITRCRRNIRGVSREQLPWDFFLSLELV
jgi:hypothetical protein